MSKYQIGDELRIRVWDDMEAEFGAGLSGSIRTKFNFTPSMRCLCGCDFTVSDIVSGDIHDKYFSVERTEYKNSDEITSQGFWYISYDMLEPRIEEPLYVATDAELKELMA